jgi:hypothetical protein
MLPVRAVRWHPTSVIGNPHFDLAILTGKRNAGRLGMRMLRNVSKRFLRDPVEAKFDVVWDVGPSFGDLNLHPCVRLTIDFLAAPPQRFHQSNMPKGSGMQVVRQISQVLRQTHRLLLKP